MPRPVSQPLVTSWKSRTRPYAAHHVAERSNLVRRATSMTTATTSAAPAAAV